MQLCCEKLITTVSFHETLNATFLAEPTIHNIPASRHLGPACHSQTHIHKWTFTVECSRASAQYCMLAPSSGSADNCRRHETCWRVHSNLMTYLPFVSLRIRLYFPRTQTVQSTQSTFTIKCTISVHIHHIVRFIYLLSLLTSSETTQKLLWVSHTFKYTRLYACVCMYVCLCVYVYRVSQEECARLRDSVPYANVFRYNPKHLCPKMNGYGDNGQWILKLWQLLHTYWLPNTY